MPTDSTVIAALIGIAGTCLAAALASMGYLYKTRQETRKNVRRVLYYLLELRAAISFYRFNPSEVADEFIKHAKRRLAEKWNVPDSELPPEVRQAFATHFGSLANAMRPDFDQGLIEHYYLALVALAESHPLLAFKLKGKEKLENALEVTRKYQEHVAAKLVAQMVDDVTRGNLASVGQDLGSQVVDEMVNDLNKDVLRTAWASGVGHYLHCRSIIRKGQGRFRADFSEVDRVIDDMVRTLIKHAASKDASSTQQNAIHVEVTASP